MMDALEQFQILQQKLQDELADVEQQLEHLLARHDDLSAVLYPTKIELEPEKSETVEYGKLTINDPKISRLLKYLKLHPGINRQEFRAAFSSKMTEQEVGNLLSYCSKRNLIENRGNKRYPKWYAV